MERVWAWNISTIWRRREGCHSHWFESFPWRRNTFFTLFVFLSILFLFLQLHFSFFFYLILSLLSSTCWLFNEPCSSLTSCLSIYTRSRRCTVCCKSFKSCSSWQDHCELLSHWSEEDSDEDSGDDFDSDEYLFSSETSDDEWSNPYNTFSPTACYTVYFDATLLSVMMSFIHNIYHSIHKVNNNEGMS